MASEPYPKSRQLARGERRYRRKIASPKQWAAIREAKLYGRSCRLAEAFPIAHYARAEELHHLVPRALGGDDIADNLIGVCRWCHLNITDQHEGTLKLLAQSLEDAEYAYIIGKLGEGGPRRLFGV